MATLVQLSDTLTLNLDTVTVLRYEDGHWLVFFHDPAYACHLTPAKAPYSHIIFTNTRAASPTPLCAASRAEGGIRSQCYE